MFKLVIIAFVVILLLFTGGFGMIRLTKRKTKKEEENAQANILSPEAFHLILDNHPEWAEQDQVKILVRRLTRSGFLRDNAFHVDEIPALKILFLYHPKTGIIADITSYQENGLRVGFTTLYKNGDILTVTNAPKLDESYRRSGWELICEPGADLTQLAAIFKKAIKPGIRLSVQNIDIERLWEERFLGNRPTPKDQSTPLFPEEPPESERTAYQSPFVEAEPLTIVNLSTLAAKVVLDQPEMPSIKILTKRIKAHFRKGPKPSKFKMKNGVMVFNLPGGSGAITLSPHPLPDQDVAAAVRESSHWPEAAQAVEDHCAHLIVTVNLSKHSLVERHLILTRLTSAVAQASEAKAVYWCNSGLLFHPPGFSRICRKADKDTQPLSVWINFRINENSHQGHNLQSKGLAAFNLMEVEMVDCGQPLEDMVEFANVMVRYLIDNGPVIRHGDTFGPDQKTKIEVVHEPSLSDPSQTVYRIMF